MGNIYNHLVRLMHRCGEIDEEVDRAYKTYKSDDKIKGLKTERVKLLDEIETILKTELDDGEKNG